MPRTQISFATCNLYNLNLPGKGIYGSNGWTTKQYNKKIEWMKQSLTAFPADVWAFQELWGVGKREKQPLETIFSATTLTNKFDLLIPSNNKGKIACAAAVRKGWLNSEPRWITNFPGGFILRSKAGERQAPALNITINKFSRPILYFQLKLPKARNKITHVYVCHFKSKLKTPIKNENWYKKETHGHHEDAIGSAISTIRRTAEATALRFILTKQHLRRGNDTPVVVLGDINDNQHSNTLSILTGQPDYIQSGRKGGSDIKLYSVATLQEYRSLRDVYYTHIFKNTHESLDHILVSQEFYDNSRSRVWRFQGMDIYNDHLSVENHKGTGTTDHGIVRATFS